MLYKTDFGDNLKKDMWEFKFLFMVSEQRTNVVLVLCTVSYGDIKMCKFIFSDKVSTPKSQVSIFKS